MKKIILVLFAIVMIVGVNAQVAKVIAPLDFSNTWVNEYTGVATDTLGTVTATTWSYEIPVNKPDGLLYVGQIKVADKTTGAAGVCTVKLQGKYFSTDAYTDITSVAWTGVGSTDSTITYTSVTNKIYYRYLRYHVTNTGGKSKIVWVKTMIKK
jgi:hypothetical protein